jgi:endonuclease/exonuclease/phosphatase (EEP) superfamily protein YafD
MRRGVTILVGLLAVVTAAGFLDRVSWVFEPATVFRLQYVVLLLAAALLALVLRQRYLVVAAVALAGINIAAIAPWQHGSRSAASSADPTLRIVAFNVKSGNHRYDQLAPLIARLQPDILGLVELTPGWARAAERFETVPIVRSSSGVSWPAGTFTRSMNVPIFGLSW